MLYEWWFSGSPIKALLIRLGRYVSMNIQARGLVNPEILYRDERGKSHIKGREKNGEQANQKFFFLLPSAFEDGRRKTKLKVRSFLLVSNA